MRAKELKAMNDLDLENKIEELKKELMKLNTQIAIGTALKDNSKSREMKRAIARILTIKHEKTSGRNFAHIKPQRGFIEKQKEDSKRNE